MEYSMKNRFLAGTFVGAIAGVSAGLVCGTLLSSASAAGNSFVATGNLTLPGTQDIIKRIEDKDAGVICYTAGITFSCVKK